ncbi:iron-sulfur cluster assembly accessory protein [Alphaproteobacteria bacterium]|nr:iron-sulfur cluster assembly accessory protein [Alphaproteobacteria bacterium]MDC0147491.1 iron-sulfur cluster assembly accessory protein [Alphaproteobacteria bacterium]
MSQVYEMPKAITLTERAAARVKTVIAGDDQGRQFVRLGVKNAGCAGLEYTLDYCEDRQPLDEVVEDKGVTVLVDPKAILFLLGTQMDYEEGLLSSGFTFNNPNQTDACGCGESVTIVPVASAK